MKKAISHCLPLTFSAQGQSASVDDEVKSLSPREVAEGLIKNPALIDTPEYDLRQIGNLLSAYDWFQILIEQPQFEKYFDWFAYRDDFSACWSQLLASQPQFASRICWWYVTRLELVAMYYRCPDIVRAQFPTGDAKELVKFFTSTEISGLLSMLPQAEELFDWKEIAPAMKEDDWLFLLSRQPQFEVHFDWSRVVGKRLWNWGILLAAQPQFAGHCDFSLLDRTQIRKILLRQIQFRDRADLSKLTASDREKIRKRYPEMEL